MSDAMFKRMQQTRIHNLEQELKKYEQVIEVQKREYFDLKKEYDDLQNELAKYRWVSVDDELPEVNEEVICRNEYGAMTLGHIDDCKFALELTDKMWETDVEGFDVRYWMLLPFEDVQEGE
jgi:predicted nuclease with TOPRIM domain